MKLKKIASLALAGIMAVSMLAGCKGATDPTEPENPVVPAGSSIASYLNTLLSEDQAKNIEFTENASLRTALNDAAAKQSVVTKTMVDSATTTVKMYSAEESTAVTTEMLKSFTSGTFATNSFPTWAKATPADKSGTDYYLWTCIYDGDMSDLAVANALYSG